jgi:hypothetical protein
MALVTRAGCAALSMLLCGGCADLYTDSEPSAAADSDACAADTDCVVGEACGYGRCGPRPPVVAAGSPLFFGAFGDIVTSKDAEDSPAPIVTNIFRELANRQVQFVTMVGDYVYVQPDSYSGALDQVSAFMQTRQLFVGPVFYALGNHDAPPEALKVYRELMTREVYFAFDLQVAPLPGNTNPATAKFVFVADNAWSADQAAWLDSTLGTPSDYTFVIRHHSTDTATSQAPAQIIGRHPLTLLIVGHVHTYQHVADREVITGNGGAPVFEGNYGYLTLQQGTDGRITVTAFDQSVDQPYDAFAVDP